MYLGDVKALNESSQFARFEIAWRFSKFYVVLETVSKTLAIT